MKTAIWVVCGSLFLSCDLVCAQSTSEKMPPQMAITPAASQIQQESLQRDAVHLRELTVELRSMLAASNSGTLPVGALKKAREVERLAKNLRQRMEKEK